MVNYGQFEEKQAVLKKAVGNNYVHAVNRSIGSLNSTLPYYNYHHNMLITLDLEASVVVLKR